MGNDYISEEQLEFVDSWFTPQALLETLFHDFENFNVFDKEKFGEIRPYQLPMISDENLIDWELTQEQLGMSKKEIFTCKKRVADLYCFGARKFGKTLMVMQFDMLNCMMTSERDKVALASVDLIHIRQVLDPVKNCLEMHPLCSMFKKRITGAPDYLIELKTGYQLNSVNFNIGSKNPGQQWLGKHVFKVYIEEASLETEEVFNKRKDALSELGAIFRISGMTDFTPHSPAGKAYYNRQNKQKVLNLPQYVSPMWDENEKNDRKEFYGGEDTIGYRVYVKGEVVEDGVSAIDMERVRRACYVEKKIIKRFDITKEMFANFKLHMVVERPSNAERIFINTDVGNHVTEVIIHSEIDSDYEYLYNITLYNLTDDEIKDVLLYLAGELKANVIGIDCGDGMGRAIYNELEKTISKDNLVWYDGSMKIQVGFETDKDGAVIFQSGKPVFKEEYMSEWSVKRIKDLLYNGRCRIPEDFKFDSQFTQVIAMMSGTRTIFKCLSKQGDHLFDAWKVFSIAQWLKKDFNQTPEIQNNWGIGAV